MTLNQFWDWYETEPHYVMGRIKGYEGADTLIKELTDLGIIYV